MCVRWVNNKQNTAAFEVNEEDLGVHEWASVPEVKSVVLNLRVKSQLGLRQVTRMTKGIT